MDITKKKNTQQRFGLKEGLLVSISLLQFSASLPPALSSDSNHHTCGATFIIIIIIIV